MATQRNKGRFAVTEETAPPCTNNLEWTDIHGEKERVYHYPDGSTFKVEGVTRLCVRPSGNHRLETSGGKKYIVRGGWNAIEAVSSHWSA